MPKIRTSYTDSVSFFGKTTPQELAALYGSPLYVYNETILRNSCRAIKNLVTLPGYAPCYATKANANPHLLSIIREEGLMGEALSPGEVAMLKHAGFKRDNIHYVCNNVSPEELAFAQENASIVSVDSLDQLDMFGYVNPGCKVMVRLNPGIGAGHHEKVVTAGKATKFGIPAESIGDITTIAAKHKLAVVGLNQHVGSLFMDPAPYLQAAAWLLETASHFPDLEYLDFGGGFGIPYHKYENEQCLDMQALGSQLTALLSGWQQKTGYTGKFIVEPGRFIAAECGLLLGTVFATKQAHGVHYVGTNLGFAVLLRPAFYDAYHDIEIYAADDSSRESLLQTIVGNICETGDVVAKNRELPAIQVNDILGVLDAGAYGHAMSSNYNQRRRPAEVLITAEGTAQLIRRRDSFRDMLAHYIVE